MSRNSSNIISFDGSSRASSRASRDVVESRAARYDESASMRGRDVYASSGRVSSHAVGETSSARGLDYSQSLDSFSSDRFARGERARFSKVTRSGRIQPIVEPTPYDDREASFAREFASGSLLALGIGPKGVEAVRLRFGRFFGIRRS